MSGGGGEGFGHGARLGGGGGGFETRGLEGRWRRRLEGRGCCCGRARVKHPGCVSECIGYVYLYVDVIAGVSCTYRSWGDQWQRQHCQEMFQERVKVGVEDKSRKCCEGDAKLRASVVPKQARDLAIGSSLTCTTSSRASSFTYSYLLQNTILITRIFNLRM